MKKFLVVLSFIYLFFISPSYAAGICEPAVNVDKQTFKTSVTFDVSGQALPNGTTVRLRLNKSSIEYSTSVNNNLAVFDLNIINAGQHSFIIIVRGQGLCTSGGIDSTFIVPDVGQGSQTTIPWMQAAGRSRTITCIQDPKGGFPSKEACEQDLRNKLTTTPTPTPPPGPCRKEGNSWVCNTALGDFQTDPAGFIGRIFGILLSLSGGIALLLIIISGYKLMTSQGNPEKVQAAREQLTSAIVGLLFIIFSLAILTIIGVDILRLPGFRP